MYRRSGGVMFRAVVGQAVGVVSIACWLAFAVYFMSRAAEPNASDAGNWFLGFVLLTVAFILVMTFWRRFFGDQE
jgi:EamA domain-containing membrane protein RarD